MTSPNLCVNCGVAIPSVVRLNLVQPWRWEGLYSVLLGEVGVPKCPRCSHTVDMPCIMAVYLPATRRLHLVLKKPDRDGMVEKITEGLASQIGGDVRVDIHETLESLRRPITEHVLGYKPLLKELTQSEQRNELPQFIARRWRELTPTALAAGLLGFTGIVKGIGGHVINRETGETLEFAEMFDKVKALFGRVQWGVWKTMVSTSPVPDYTFDHALGEHVREGGIFAGSMEMLYKVVRDLTVNKKAPALLYYTLHALHASVAKAEKSKNDFEDHWGEAYFAFELALTDGADPAFRLWQLSPERAAGMITEKVAWDVIARRFRARHDHAALGAIVERLSYKDLVTRVVATMHMVAPKQALLDLVDEVLTQPAMKSLPGWPVSPVRALTETLVDARDVDLIDRVYAKLEILVAPESNEQASLEAWYGECMKWLRQPRRFIERVGERSRPWEANLGLGARVDLWNERSNAFRLLGNARKALELTNEIVELMGDREVFANQRAVLLRNRGILLRETGAADESRRQLKSLIEKCKLEDRGSLLESYAATCQALGRHDEAIESLREAITVSFKKTSTIERLEAYLALECSLGDRAEDALEILAKLQDKEQPVEVRSAIAAAYVNLLFRRVELSPSHQQRLADLLASLTSIQNELENRGDIHLAIHIMFLLGMASYAARHPSAEKLLQRHLDLLQKAGRPPDPSSLARLAASAYRQKDRDSALEILDKLPDALVDKFHAVQDISVAYEMTEGLTASLNDLMRSAMSNAAPWSDCRLIAELKRDTIGRARIVHERRSRMNNTTRLKGGVGDDQLAAIAQKVGSFAVLEWLDDGGSVFALLTTVAVTGEVHTNVLGAPSLGLFQLRESIQQRLSVWHEKRAGNPFDIVGWKELEAWLEERIGALIGPGAHIVVIEGGGLVGIPWHVALSPRWRCSYAASWSTILDTAAPDYATPTRVGVFAAPRYRDSPAVCGAIGETTGKMQNWVNGAGMAWELSQDGAADRAAFTRLMAECDVVALFCHGYTNPDDLEIALLVSAHGALPPLFAPNRGNGWNSNTLSWRNMQSLERTAPLVLSAACSTGIHWQAGAGEQMGLMGALRRGGTRALIAPRWDITASLVLPLLPEILSKHFDGKMKLVDALHQTCIEAERKMPRWLAWSLALEGTFL